MAPAWKAGRGRKLSPGFESLRLRQLRMGGRAADCTRFENERTERYRGFESHPSPPTASEASGRYSETIIQSFVTRCKLKQKS